MRSFARVHIWVVLLCFRLLITNAVQNQVRWGGRPGWSGPDARGVCTWALKRDVYTWVCDSRIPPHTMYPFKFNLNLNLNLNLNYPFGTNIQLKLMM
jgi:hypothetical protein